MKITDIRLTQLEGVLEHSGELWEERLVRPIDIYPEYRAQGAHYTSTISHGQYRVQAVFLELLTDEGATGLAGPISGDVAFTIAHQLKSIIVGQDPLAHELIWDQLREMGCELGQGYYFARPLPPGELTQWIRTSPWGR